MFILLSFLFMSKITVAAIILYFLYFNFFSKLSLYLIRYQFLQNLNISCLQFSTSFPTNFIWSPIFKKNFFLGHFINNVCWR